jgi:predicted porin
LKTRLAHIDIPVAAARWVIIAAAGPLLASAPLCSRASDELDVYGRINLTLQNSDEALQEEVELQSNSSRLGVKGEIALSPGLKAIYQLEWGVNIDAENSDDTLTPRNQFVGLEGGFGTIRIGRHDTALKQAQGRFDLFDDLEGDIGKVFNGENRLRNYIGYVTPTFGRAFTLTANFSPGEDPTSGNDGVADKTSVSMRYQTDLAYAAIAHDSDVDGDGVDTTRLVAGHAFGRANVMLLYQKTDSGLGSNDGFGASVAWTHGNYVAKFQYLSSDTWRTQRQPDPLDNRLDSLLSVGLDRKLGDSARVFGFCTTGDIGGTDERNTYLAVGIELNF